MAEMGLSVAKSEKMRSPGKAGGAAQSLEGVQARCLPGGDGIDCESELTLEIGGEKEIPRVAQASANESDITNTQIVKAINKNQSVSDNLKRSANLSESLKECKIKIEFLKEEKRKKEYLKMLFKCEELDLENFDLAEAFVMEIVHKSSELSFENEMDRKNEK